MRALRIGIVNYGMGNIGSVCNAFSLLGVSCVVVHSPDELKCDAYVLPGVGAFGVALKNFREQGFEEPLARAVLAEGRPLLGICLGMQLLARSSSEQGRHVGLGWVDAEVVRLEPGNGLRVPHVGWNAVDFIGGAIMFDNIDMQSPHFYFDHSYHFECDEQYVVAVADYGGPVVSAICKGNVWATQFHPEKSQRNGLKLLKNYVKFVAGGLGGCGSHCGSV